MNVTQIKQNYATVLNTFCYRMAIKNSKIWTNAKLLLYWLSNLFTDVNTKIKDISRACIIVRSIKIIVPRGGYKTLTMKDFKAATEIHLLKSFSKFSTIKHIQIK